MEFSSFILKVQINHLMKDNLYMDKDVEVEFHSIKEQLMMENGKMEFSREWDFIFIQMVTFSRVLYPKENSMAMEGIF